MAKCLGPCNGTGTTARYTECPSCGGTGQRPVCGMCNEFATHQVGYHGFDGAGARFIRTGWRCDAHRQPYAWDWSDGKAWTSTASPLTYGAGQTGMTMTLKDLREDDLQHDADLERDGPREQE